MKLNLIGPFKVNAPFATEIAFAKGLRANGHTVVEFDPNLDDPAAIDRDADFTVVFKTALRHNDHLLGLRNVVLYQPDDLRFSHIREMVLMMRRYSEHLIVFRDYGEGFPPETNEFNTVSVLPVTADPDLYYHEPFTERDIDFCFIGSLGSSAHWQRLRMRAILESLGHRVVFGSTNDVSVIRRMYGRSKIVVNHASDEDLPFGSGYGYQCRHFEVGMTRSCLLSNFVLDDVPKLIDGYVPFRDEAQFIDRAQHLLEDGLLREHYSSALYSDVITRHSPSVRAGQLVRILEIL